jgi:hypothetical protein
VSGRGSVKADSGCIHAGAAPGRRVDDLAKADFNRTTRELPGCEAEDLVNAASGWSQTSGRRPEGSKS